MTVDIPAILAQAIGCRSIIIEAVTVDEALAKMRAHPKLGPLIFDESNTPRRHVLIFVNDVALQHLPSLEIDLKPGDRISVVQAVSGG